MDSLLTTPQLQAVQLPPILPLNMSVHLNQYVTSPLIPSLDLED